MRAPSDVPALRGADAERLARGLAVQRYLILEDFADAELWRPLGARVRRAERVGELHPAAVGQGSDRALRPEIRADRIAWVDPADPDPALAAYRARMEALRLALNELSYLGLLELESHFAAYAAGAGYARHVDRFARDSRRVLSTVLYLNEDWDASDGGELRLYLERGSVEVVPRGGTLAIFGSELAHEVLPAQRARYSVAGWFRRRA